MYLAIIANSQTFAITRDYDFIIFEDLIAFEAGASVFPCISSFCHI